MCACKIGHRSLAARWAHVTGERNSAACKRHHKNLILSIFKIIESIFARLNCLPSLLADSLSGRNGWPIVGHSPLMQQFAAAFGSSSCHRHLSIGSVGGNNKIDERYSLRNKHGDKLIARRKSKQGSWRSIGLAASQRSLASATSFLPRFSPHNSQPAKSAASGSHHSS